MLAYGILIYFIYVMMVGAIAISYRNMDRDVLNRRLKVLLEEENKKQKELEQLEERQQQKGKDYWYYLGWW